MLGAVYWVSLLFFGICVTSCVPQKTCCEPTCGPTQCESYDFDFEDSICMRSDFAPISSEDFEPIHKTESNYTLSPGDVLSLSLYNDSETRVKESIVAPDGKLYYAMFNGEQAKGLTIEELREKLTLPLQRYFVDPGLIISPVRIRDQNFSLVGAVARPGIYPLEGAMTLLEAIARGGGLAFEKVTDSQSNSSSYEQDNLSRVLIDYDESYLIRKNGKKVDVDFKKLLEGDPTQNVMVRPGDSIIVGFKDEETVFVLGYVREPGRLRYTPGLNLIEALAWARGWFHPPEVHRGNLNKVLVIRGDFCHPCVIVADVTKIVRGEMLNLSLEPGDIIYVPEIDFSFAREVVRAFVFAFVQAFASQAGDYYGELVWFPVPGTNNSGN